MSKIALKKYVEENLEFNLEYYLNHIAHEFSFNWLDKVIIKSKVRAHQLITVKKDLVELKAKTLITVLGVAVSKDFVERILSNLPFFERKEPLIVELARIYALSSGSLITETPDRLKAAAESQKISKDDERELSEALYFLNSLRFKHQINALNNNEELSNNLVPDTLSQFERNHLKDAFRIIAKQQEAAKFRFCGGI